MGRKRIKDGLGDFSLWLVGQGKAASTAATYASRVRKTLNEVGDRSASAEFMQGYWESVSPLSRPDLTSAWRMYTLYMGETKGLDLPVPGDSRNTSTESKPCEPLPENITEAVRALREAPFSFKEISLLAWGDVDLDDLLQPGTQFIHVTNPLDRSMTSWVQKEAIEALYEWGEPGADHQAPLIPREPRSSEPYPIRLLQKEANKGLPSILDQARAARAAASANSGSALAAAKSADPLALYRGKRTGGSAGHSSTPVTPHTYTSQYLKAPPPGATPEELLGLGSLPPGQQRLPSAGQPIRGVPLRDACKGMFSEEEEEEMLEVPDLGYRGGGQGEGNGAEEEGNAGERKSNELPRPEGVANGLGNTGTAAGSSAAGSSAPISSTAPVFPVASAPSPNEHAPSPNEHAPQALPTPAQLDMMAALLQRGVEPAKVAEFLRALGEPAPVSASVVTDGTGTGAAELVVGGDGLMVDP